MFSKGEARAADHVLKPYCVRCSNFLMPRLMDVRPMMIMTLFGHFIFKAHFENFLEFLDSPTKEVN